MSRKKLSFEITFDSHLLNDEAGEYYELLTMDTFRKEFTDSLVDMLEQYGFDKDNIQLLMVEETDFTGNESDAYAKKEYPYMHDSEDLEVVDTAVRCQKCQDSICCCADSEIKQFYIEANTD